MEDKIYEVPAEWSRRAYLDEAAYQAKYDASIRDPETFWAEEARRIHWFSEPTRIKNTNFGPGEVSIRWFEDGVTNVAYNCIDRHLPHPRRPGRHHLGRRRPVGIASRSPIASCTTRSAAWRTSCATAASRKGDRVTIYMPMIPEAAYAMLACARIGAIHSVVFGGFSPDSLASRISDAKSAFVITADEGLRGGRKVPLKVNVDAAIERVGGVDHVLVVRRTGSRRQHGAGPRRLLRRGRGDGDRRMPGRGDERGGPAVHPLHLGLDRPAEGRAAHHRRLSRLRGDDAPIRVRLS